LVDVATLVERCRSGDGLAWEALVRLYQARVYGLALHYLRNAEEARDVAQDVFVSVYRHLDRFGGGEFLPWLLCVARNASIDRLRRLRSRPQQHDVGVEDDAELPSDAPGPEEQSSRQERRRLLYRALGALSESHREIVLLKEIEGLTLEEIATLLGVPVGTLKSRSHRARLELARRVLELDPSYGAVG
jgi:RNA polymerase sigma-70 factor (ECF subfamily)